MGDEPIPLWDGEPSGAAIVPETKKAATEPQTVRAHRQWPRSTCEDVRVCFSPELPSGGQEHVECPVIDKSAQGLAIEYDRRLGVGVRGQVAYLTVGHQPVRVTCSVRRCTPMENGRFLIGLRLDRLLSFEEKRLAKATHGQLAALGLRPRKLRDTLEATAGTPAR
jgi:hypothetical protein